MQGKFIVFEGIDGSGKTTQLQLLAEKFKTQQISVVTTKEPTDGPIGSLARNVLNRRLVLDEKTLATLYLADRLDHIQNPVNGMLHDLQKGKTILCDRYYLSSYAYHSSHVPLQWVINANSECAKLMRPDIIFFLDVQPDVSLKRLQQSRDFLDLFETQERLEQVRANYFTAIERVKAAENIVVLDATQSQVQLANQIWTIVQQLNHSI